MLKFAATTRTIVIAGHVTPGNSLTRSPQPFQSRVVTDPSTDHQSLSEASYVNLPSIALCNTDSPLPCVDIAIPCNKKGAHSPRLIWQMLAQEVLCVHGTIPRKHPWEVVRDLYFCRDPEEVEKEEQTAAVKAVTRRNFRVNEQLQLLS